MAALTEQILDLVATKLATITVANGYVTTVATVYRAMDGVPPLAQADAVRPFVEIRHLGTSRRWHLRAAYECLMQIELVMGADQGDQAIRDLVGDVLKLCASNRLWNDGSSNLADRSWCGDGDIHEPEVDAREATATLQLWIKCYEDETNAAAVKAI